MTAAAGGLGVVVPVDLVLRSRPSPAEARRIVLALAVSLSLAMCGLGILVPVIPRRFEDLGAGVEALGLMYTAYALAQVLAAPLMGSLGDRIGRRPVLLISFATYVGVNVALGLAEEVWLFVVARAAEGALTAGLFPVATAVVSDVIPPKRRATWIGIVTGSYGLGFIVGPIAGGALYAAAGSGAAFAAAAILAAAGLLGVLALVPETRPLTVRRRLVLLARRAGLEIRSWRDALPAPRHLFVGLLSVDFVVLFAFAFVGPQLVFFAYDVAGMSTLEYGLVIAASSLAMVLVQSSLGGLSDRLGRRPVMVVALLLYGLSFLGYAVFNSVFQIVLLASLGGAAFGLYSPAATAFYLDITPESSRSRVLGIRTSVMAVGGVLGPLLLVILRPVITPANVFVGTGVTIIVAAVLAFAMLRSPRGRGPIEHGPDDGAAAPRALLADSTLHGLVTAATATRATRKRGVIADDSRGRPG